MNFVKDIPKEINSIAICGSAYKGGGGVSRVIDKQAKEILEAGYETTIFALDSDIDPPNGASLEVIGIPEKNLVGRAYRLIYPFSPHMIKLIRKLKEYDLLICHRYPLTVAGYFCKSLFGGTYVYWFHHAVNPRKFVGLSRIWVKIFRYLEMRNLAVRKADYICSVSEISKKKIDTANEFSSIIIPNQVEEDRFEEVANLGKLRKKYSLNNNRVILFVGRLTPQKNIHSLLKIFYSIKSQLNNIKLVIAGYESEKNYVRNLKKIADENVIFTGYVQDKELAGLYSLSNVFTTCSLSEGWSLPPAEADLFETPVVAFKNNISARTVSEKDLAEPGNYKQFRKKLLKALKEGGYRC